MTDGWLLPEPVFGRTAKCASCDTCPRSSRLDFPRRDPDLTFLPELFEVRSGIFG